jgi:hypothetical protein
MADISNNYTEYILRNATDSYWPAQTYTNLYNSKCMTLKNAYDCSAAVIAQNSTTVIGRDLLNKTGTGDNAGFTAAQTRIGFFYNLRYYANGNTDSDASNNTTDVGFTKYLKDPEFTTSSIAKFAQMVNYGETASMTAKDYNDSNFLIPPYSTSNSDNSGNNVIFYNLFKYLRALYDANLSGNTQNLFKYMDASNIETDNFLDDLFVLNGRDNTYTDIDFGSIDPTEFSIRSVDKVKSDVKIAMFMRFKLAGPSYGEQNSNFQNTIFINNFYYSILKTTPISIIDDYYKNNLKTAQTLFLQNLFTEKQIFGVQTVPELWNGGQGVSVKQFVEFYESEGYSPSDIFAKLYPYIPLENLLSYRTYYSDSTGITQDSGQQSSDASGNPNVKSGVFYYTDPQDTNTPKQPYADNSRWISVKDALHGMDSKWGLQWNTNGDYYTDKNSDAPSIDQVLAALSIIDGNSASLTPIYGIDTGTTKNYSYTTGLNQTQLTTTTPVIQEIREAYSTTDGSHNAIVGYNNINVNTYPENNDTPTIKQLVALIENQNIPFAFAKFIFAATIIIRASIYTRDEKRGLFAPNDIITIAHAPANDGGLADAYYQLSQLVNPSSNYTYPTDTNNVEYYTPNTLVEDLINLKFPINAYNDFLFNEPINPANSTTSTSTITIPSPGLSENPFTTYGLLTAYETNIQSYDEDGFAINVLGQLIWHTAAERTYIIDIFETGRDASEYKYNPAGDNSGNIDLYSKVNGIYYYARPENIASLRDVYRIEQREFYKADTRFGRGMSNDPNLNILIALGAIGIPATIALKFRASAYSPFTNKNIGGNLDSYNYIRGTNTQSSRIDASYNGGVYRNLLNFTAYDLLSAFESGPIDSDENGFVFASQNRLLWNTLSERDEIIDAFSNTDDNLLKYNPTATNPVDKYGKVNGHYYLSYPQNLNDFDDLVGNRSTTIGLNP